MQKNDETNACMICSSTNTSCSASVCKSAAVTKLVAVRCGNVLCNIAEGVAAIDRETITARTQTYLLVRVQVCHNTMVYSGGWLQCSDAPTGHAVTPLSLPLIRESKQLRPEHVLGDLLLHRLCGTVMVKLLDGYTVRRLRTAEVARVPKPGRAFVCFSTQGKQSVC